MVKRINILDNETSNKIAAGEVVERPASVVKELTENSIDAGAGAISIEIEEGGLKSIKITDDGTGIHPEDVEKAFLPHATSKIQNVEDIYQIHTLGFRGEALASIASISHTILRSRSQEADYGKEISIIGGEVDYIREVGANVGTSIEVQDIFYNVPARQKFLKSVQRESAAISDIVGRLALANPQVAFKLYHNKKNVITTYSTKQLSDTIRMIYGKTTYEHIISFEKHSDTASVHGYIGDAEISKGSRNHQSIFVNKRFIRNKLITTAVESAVKSFFTVNKFPFFVLFLDIFPEFVDVNVHPTKSEVKFRDDREIFKLVFDAVHAAMRQSLKDSFDIPYDIVGEEKTIQGSEAGNIIQLPIDLQSGDEFESRRQLTEKNLYGGSTSFVPPAAEPFLEEAGPKYDAEFRDYKTTPGIETQKCLEQEERVIAKVPPLRIIGQFRDTYILAEGNDGLYIIDQHAAHEKVLFEKFRHNIRQREVVAQILMSPLILELSAEDFLYFTENKEIFRNTGFNIEVFGENTISIREVPFILGKPEVRELFMGILVDLKRLGTGETVDVKYDKIASLACKAAIKANDKLSEAEMKALLDALRYAEDPFTCPHGRPTIIKMTILDLEKKFKRIQ